MHAHEAAPPAKEGRGPRFEVADIFRDHGEAYRRSHALTPEQRKAMRDIVTCRTAVLGGHLDVCPDCDFSRPAYNSCRNRHCPKCQALKQAAWVDARRGRILPTHYFHVVFTVPQELKPLAQRNPVRVYDIMFASAAATLLDLGRDAERLGGILGVTAVLHTWTRSLTYHPHIHCIVTGGALAADRSVWIPARRRYLFPIKVMGALFRGKVLAAISQARARGQLTFAGACAELGDDSTFSRWKDALYRTDWVTYSKTPFGGPEQVFNYLGRYTHRVGISNHRIISADETAVRFATKAGGTCTLSPQDFIGRFLLHVLPRSFVKIRHFGLLSPSNVNTKLLDAAVVAARSSHPRPQTRRPQADLARSTPPPHRRRPQPLPGVHRGPRLDLASSHDDWAAARASMTDLDSSPTLIEAAPTPGGPPRVCPLVLSMPNTAEIANLALATATVSPPVAPEAYAPAPAHTRRPPVAERDRRSLCP